MRALQLRTLGHLDEVELPVPQPAHGELLVRTRATTICTSDIHDMTYNPFGTSLPKVLGHEGAGRVAALGSGVSSFAIGDRVAAHPVIPCGACESCLRGLAHLCERMGHLGVDRDGTFAGYFCIPASRARKLPDEVDYAVGALLEPLCVCLEAVRRARIVSGESVLVAGDGPFGVLIARLALQAGAQPLILAGTEPFRMGHVSGAQAVNITRFPSLLEARQSFGGEVDAAILAVSSAEALDMCLQSLRARGRLVVFAGIAQPVPVDLFRVHLKELEILGACNDEDYLDEALSRLADPALNLHDLVTHRIPFASWRDAFDLATRRKDRALKVAITFEDEAS
jgi:2-desacetyl-2-hydroxyethyl bacteriochlorophyllide A dehydrogenase